jgi:hypothetical protein
MDPFGLKVIFITILVFVLRREAAFYGCRQ